MENNYKKKKYPENKKDYRSDKPRRDGNRGGNRSGRDRRDGRDSARFSSNATVGRNAVLELIRSGAPVDKVYVSSRDGFVSSVIAEAKEAGITVIDSTPEALDRFAGGENHQGIVAIAAEKKYSTVDEILEIAAERGELPLIVICDGVEDPHNLGAIIRCAECSGAHGVIIPERRACGLTPAVSKASAGAIAHMAVAKVVNIAETIELLKKKGVWTFAAEADGIDFYEADFKCPCAIVLGGEDSGVGRLVRERCDFTVSIPMYGKVNSLNVSTAASVLLSRAARVQRT
jgi:23S rRNA (guanosine2251-2'-O)-methyltransferase